MVRKGRQLRYKGRNMVGKVFKRKYLRKDK